MDSCFALSGAHQHGIAVRSINRENLCLKDTLLPRQVQSTPLSARSTQYMWHLLAGNRIAVLPQHARGRQIRSYPDLCASKFNKTNLKQHTYTIPGPGQYLTHAHSHITRAGEAMDNCFTLLVGVCASFVLSLREVLARLWVGVCVCPLLNLTLSYDCGTFLSLTGSGIESLSSNTSLPKPPLMSPTPGLWVSTLVRFISCRGIS